MKYLIIFLGINITMTYAQDYEMPIWDNEIPNYLEVGESEIIDNESEIEAYKLVNIPKISVYLPSNKNSSGQAVLIIPGGGYQAVVHKWEGSDIAKWLNSNGIAGIVLKYRLPNSKNNIIRDKSPLLDATRAIRVVRENAEKWNIDKDNIGVMGFSAGGHLASTLGTHFDEKIIDEKDSTNARPDFMVLVYPVISMDAEFTHVGSRINLLGNNPTKELREYYSGEEHVTENTPPTFLVHTSDDEVVNVENSLFFYKALRNKNVKSEMHIFPHGEHGFSLANGLDNLEIWKTLCVGWLRNYNK